MEAKYVIEALSALAHETRLAIFRALVTAGPEGLAAGEIATTLNVAPSTLSHHLTLLDHAGIITSRRQQRFIYYTIVFAAVRDLLGFLIEDCCEGAPELCGFARSNPKEKIHV